MKRTLFLAALFFILSPQLLLGQIPQTISFQAVITDADGNAIPDGNATLTFKIYNVASGGSALYEETQVVAVVSGIADVILGSSATLDLPFDVPYFLGITLDGGTEQQPRIPLTSSAYSLNARSVADNSVSTAKIQDAAITKEKIAGGQVVKSISVGNNSLQDDVTLAAGANVTITPTDNTITISATGGVADGDWTISGNDMFSAVSGNVGIGTTSPAFQLSLGSSLARTKLALFETAADNSYGLGVLAGLFRLHLNGSGARFAFFDSDEANANEIVTIKGTGNVGIGTTAPGAPLVVQYSSANSSISVPAIVLDNPTGGIRTALSFRQAGIDKVVMNATQNSDLIINRDGFFAIANKANTQRHLTVQGNGNVGIGTTNPLGKLDVNGSIFQRGGQLHADYVFEPDYQLETIEEHTEFMWKNKHLKAIPKATSDENGQEIVEVGAHRKGIVEELEKAHIFIEELHNRIKGLEERLAKLEVVLSAGQ